MIIDVTRLVHRTFKGMLPTGVDRVSHAYLRHYGNRAAALVRAAGVWAVLGQTESARVFDSLLDPGPRSARRLAWRIGCGLTRAAGGDGHTVLLNTGHSGLERSSYGLEVRRRALSPVYFAHDLIPLSHPQYSRAGEDRRHARRLQTMLETGRALIVNSRATRAAVADYAAAQGLRLPECVVAPLAPAPLSASLDAAPLARPYFVMLGTIEPRKNHLLLLQVWRRLVETLGTDAPQLVVIGRRGWECDHVFELLERCPILRGHVLEESHCGDRQLSTWLRHARALLFPSFTEGFGMPLVEALSLGTPVIASDLPVFREIAGATPEYLDPCDRSGWQSAVLDYSQPASTRRRSQIERVACYAAPTWNAHFELVDCLLDRLQFRSAPTKANGGWAYVPGH